MTLITVLVCHYYPSLRKKLDLEISAAALKLLSVWFLSHILQGLHISHSQRDIEAGRFTQNHQKPAVESPVPHPEVPLPVCEGVSPINATDVENDVKTSLQHLRNLFNHKYFPKNGGSKSFEIDAVSSNGGYMLFDLVGESGELQQVDEDELIAMLGSAVHSDA